MRLEFLTAVLLKIQVLQCYTVLLCKQSVAKQYYILEDLNLLYIIFVSALSDINTLYTCLSILDTLKSLKCHTFFISLLCVCVFVYVHVLYHHLRLN